MKMSQTRKNSTRQDFSMKEYSQIDNLQISCSKQEIDDALTFSKSKKMWTKKQEEHFWLFWMERIVADPLNVYSFDSPLKRSSYFKELSQFLKSKGYRKNHMQCKSKFETTRRKIRREKRRKLRVREYELLDYIIEVGRTAGESQDIAIIIPKLQAMKDKESEFMKITKQIIAFEERVSLEKNNSICAYLNELGMLPCLSL